MPQDLKMCSGISRLKTSVGYCPKRNTSTPASGPRALRLKTPQDAPQDPGPQDLSGRLLKTRAKFSRLKTLQEPLTRVKVLRLKISVGDRSRRVPSPRASRPQWETAQDAPPRSRASIPQWETAEEAPQDSIIFPPEV
ncbi:hypothetical protein DFH08DRAFT_806483 [Mycena albidolilacea]|uniref:Uncharacterized protein n=1 Tax=Mycena albidolilacea TaxID=1033008 RepID=A0AAD7A6A4_9AGAR|nr:hypothetical protein DFH08DRAFT_806483 [Mycena albidolilacea]